MISKTIHDPYIVSEIKGEQYVGSDGFKSDEKDIKYQNFVVKNHWRKGVSGYLLPWYPCFSLVLRHFSNYPKGPPFL